MASIKNGSNGDIAKVDAENRLHVHAFSVDLDTSAALKGDAFDLCSGVVNSTSAGEQCGLIYIKNNEDDDLIISLQFLNVGTPIAGTDEGRVTFHLNPTGGTLISEASAAQVANRRIGDSKLLTAAVYKPASAAAGKTVTGGTEITLPSTGFAANAPFILPQGQSFAISYTTPVNSSDVDVSAGLYVIKNATKHGND